MKDAHNRDNHREALCIIENTIDEKRYQQSLEMIVLTVCGSLDFLPAKSVSFSARLFFVVIMPI